MSNNPMRLGLAVVATTAILAGVDAATAEAHADNPHVRILPACTIEDASSGPVPCVWFAPAMGNGKGHSFRVYRDGRVKYITDRRAFALIGECDSDGPVYC